MIHGPRAVPATIGPYTVVRRMAAGGMSEILLAHKYGPQGYERSVIIKILRLDWTDSEEASEDFLREAKMARSLEHPNIVKVISVGESELGPYLVMEYVFGQSLRQVLDRAHQMELRPSSDHIRTILYDALSALMHAHGNDPKGALIHRDVSPSNLLIGFDGVVRLLDFGLAKKVSDLSATRAGVVKGKYGYMSPEQLRREELDSRSDLFSTGIVLWELLCGGPLFTSQNDPETIQNVLGAHIAFPRLRRPSASWDLSWVAWRALRRKRSLRYSSAEAMRRAIAFRPPSDEARDRLQRYMEQLYFVELNARDLALHQARDDPPFFRQVRDSGFELLPEVTDPAIPSLKRGVTHYGVPIAETEKTKRPLGLWLASLVLVVLGLVALFSRSHDASEKIAFIQVEGQNGAQVWVADRFVGRSPISRVSVPPGVHALRWGIAERPTHERIVELRPGETRLIQLDETLEHEP